MDIDLESVVFTGFHKHVIALDRNTGQILWDWACPNSSGYISLLLTDNQHLIVSVNGYTYCLDPGTGNQRWFNELSGYGIGVASLASAGKQSAVHPLMAAAADDAGAMGSGVVPGQSFT